MVRSRTGHENHGEVRDESGDTGEVRDGSRDPRGGPRLLGGPSMSSGTGRGTLEEGRN